MKNLTAEDIERKYTIKQLISFNKKLKEDLHSISFEKKRILNQQESIIKKEVALQTNKYKLELKEKDKIINDKDKQIEALKEKIAKMQSKIDNDSTNSGLPTSKTAIGKKKYIPNSRKKTGNSIGSPIGHKKHKLIPFKDDEVTEIVDIIPKECNKCHSKDLEQLSTSTDKQELDYEVVVIKRKNRFISCRCKKCGNEFHVNIPNDLKEDIQYGKTVQSMAVCLTNEIYTPFNKTVKLVDGITNGEIKMSEGYVTKLQKKAANFLENFIKELKDYIPKQDVYGWDDGVVAINTKDGILRTYCTDKVALFIGHEQKNAKSLDEDGILLNTSKDKVVMHDHLLHNYNDKYDFKNVECMVHLIRRLKKKQEETKHKWCEEMINLLSKTNNDRNKFMEEGKESFDNNYLSNLNKNYDAIISKAKIENEDKITINYFKKEEEKFIKDLIKYKDSYLLWAYDFRLPSTNNNSERKIRPVKSKMKISGHFQNIKYLQYYATIRSYIETCKVNGINIINACEHLMYGNPYTLSEVLEISKNSE